MKELVAAAIDVCRANCRSHRERATNRLRAAVEGMAKQTDARGKLLQDLALFALDYDDDPEAEDLVKRAVTLGVLRNMK